MFEGEIQYKILNIPHYLIIILKYFDIEKILLYSFLMEELKNIFIFIPYTIKKDLII